MVVCDSATTLLAAGDDVFLSVSAILPEECPLLVILNQKIFRKQ